MTLGPHIEVVGGRGAVCRQPGKEARRNMDQAHWGFIQRNREMPQLTLPGADI